MFIFMAKDLFFQGKSMTQDEIIELARQAGFEEHQAKFDTRIEAFAKLIEEKEREACAKLIESHGSTLVNGFMLTEAIRARGQA